MGDVGSVYSFCTEVEGKSKCFDSCLGVRRLRLKQGLYLSQILRERANFLTAIALNCVVSAVLH